MAARNEMQFEKLIDEVTRKKDFQFLERFLATEDCENVSHKCSKQFVNKLDKLLCRELDKQEIKSISILLNSIEKCGKKISIAGEDGLLAMIKYGLIGRVKGILILSGNEKNEMLISLAEDFFNVLLAICDSRAEGKIKILENFLLRTCTLIADVRINIYVQHEKGKVTKKSSVKTTSSKERFLSANFKVVRKLNLMLDNAPRDARKKLFSTKEMLLVMSDMGRRILDAGDYDLQVAITEALCRMIAEKQRGQLAYQWFSMEFVSNAFKGIKDSEFETDCRKFLNQVNGMLGDKRRVFTYPCLSAALDKYELQIPLDENLEEFWVDFNVGSRSISFYVAADDADHQWETVIIPEEEVDLYSLEEKESKKLLTIDLKSPMSVGNQEGEKFFLYFDSILEIRDVTRKIYGFSKCKGFQKKQSASVAKTTVHVVFDESGSQVLVPESQLSPCLEERSEEMEKLRKYKTQQLPGTLRTLNKNNNQEKCRGGSSKVTASSKRKVSEASVAIPGTTRFSTKSPLTFVSMSTPCKGRFKLPLEMMSSSEKSNNNVVNETRTKNLYQGPTGSGRRCTLDNEFSETEQMIKKPDIRNEAKVPEKQMCADKILEMLEEAEIEATQKQTLDEALDIVPDSQPLGRSNNHLLSGLLESSFDKTRTSKKRACSVPDKNITTGGKQNLNPSLAHMSHPVRVSETSLYSDFAREEPDVALKKETANPKQSKTKTKSKEVTDATKSLISKISDRYKVKTDGKSKARDSLGFSRTHLNKPCVSKEEVQDRNLNSTTFLNVTAGHIMDDVYNFNISGFDEPTIKLGIHELHVTELSVRKDPNKKGNADDSKTSTEVKGRKKTINNQNKKHLFSDTDTEYRGEDSKTDISWLQESNRKSKAQLIDYSRNKNLGKPISTDNSKFSEPACQVDKPKGKSASKKKINECKKQNSKTDETIEQTTRQKRPRRAALAKNYKEPSSSESESEGKSSACTSKEEKSKIQKHVNGEKKDGIQQRELQNIVSVEPKRVANYVHKVLIKSKNSAELKEIEMPSSESPLSLETLRCAESFKPCFSDTLSIKGKLQDTTKPITRSKEDSIPTSPLSVSSGSKVQSWSEEPYGPIHESGPTIQTFLKRRDRSDTESNSDEAEPGKEEEKRGKRRTKLQPRKLFKTDDAVTYRVSESLSTISVNDLSVLDGEIWEPGCSTISICQKLQKECTKKIESRSRKMDHFTKQSLRAAHEHLTTMIYQLHECRIRQLDKFHFALLEELENFEKDSQSLKNMEKEFSTFWKKHTLTFSTYMKNEQQRIQILKTSFEKNIYHAVDYEERIFTSEMLLMKEDIKGLQEKLLKEMQEEELCNVRRGLQTLFQSEDRILK